MNLSVIAAGVTITLILIFGWLSYKYEYKPEPPDISRFPFNQATGKERSFVNKTSDTSLWIESTRRRTIAKTYRPDFFCGAKSAIKETKHTTGSTSGALEAYILSGFGRICPPACAETIFDGGDDGDEYYNIIDGNGD